MLSAHFWIGPVCCPCRSSLFFLCERSSFCWEASGLRLGCFSHPLPAQLSFFHCSSTCGLTPPLVTFFLVPQTPPHSSVNPIFCMLPFLVCACWDPNAKASPTEFSCLFLPRSSAGCATSDLSSQSCPLAWVGSFLAPCPIGGQPAGCVMLSQWFSLRSAFGLLSSFFPPFYLSLTP